MLSQLKFGSVFKYINAVQNEIEAMMCIDTFLSDKQSNCIHTEGCCGASMSLMDVYAVCGRSETGCAEAYQTEGHTAECRLLRCL